MDKLRDNVFIDIGEGFSGELSGGTSQDYDNELAVSIDDQLSPDNSRTPMLVPSSEVLESDEVGIDHNHIL